MGKLFVAGIGFPGLISPLAESAVKNADLVVGYKPYIDEIEPMLTSAQERFSNGMRGETERAAYAVSAAIQGRTVCIVCSGDPTLFGMAALVYETAEGKGLDIEVLPSVSAAFAASSLLGAPITEDTVFLSMSDYLTPWGLIQKRVDAVNAGDFVCAVYNPWSQRRTTQLLYTLRRFREERGDLLTGTVRNAYRKGSQIYISTIDAFDMRTVDMSAVVIVGCTKTKLIDGKMITPRGYTLK
ncbi:MAG: precorrin-3B C(17)-methyltransferase [Deferribacteraceae bacterium]|jgi:precorrin-3B C17-methyltransferase|nr:precorrin-3B C(17)-methyltransferase [Deferribacteraceae bacterium]